MSCVQKTVFPHDRRGQRFSSVKGSVIVGFIGWAEVMAKELKGNTGVKENPFLNTDLFFIQTSCELYIAGLEQQK